MIILNFKQNKRTFIFDDNYKTTEWKKTFKDSELKPKKNLVNFTTDESYYCNGNKPISTKKHFEGHLSVSPDLKKYVHHKKSQEKINPKIALNNSLYSEINNDKSDYIVTEKFSVLNSEMNLSSNINKNNYPKIEKELARNKWKKDLCSNPFIKVDTNNLGKGIKSQEKIRNDKSIKSKNNKNDSFWNDNDEDDLNINNENKLKSGNRLDVQKEKVFNIVNNQVYLSQKQTNKDKINGYNVKKLKKVFNPNKIQQEKIIIQVILIRIFKYKYQKRKKN